MAAARQSLIRAEVATLRRSLTVLDRALRRLSASMNGSPVAFASAGTRRKLTITPARRAALKLQGQYMGYLRNLKPKQKAVVKALRVAKGIRPAIAMARKFQG